MNRRAARSESKASEQSKFCDPRKHSARREESESERKRDRSFHWNKSDATCNETPGQANETPRKGVSYTAGMKKGNWGNGGSVVEFDAFFSTNWRNWRNWRTDCWSRSMVTAGSDMETQMEQLEFDFEC